MGKRKILLLLMAVLLLVSIPAGVSYARYIMEVKKQVQFQHKVSPNLSMVALPESTEETPGEEPAEEPQVQKPVWIQTGNQAQLPFAVTCQNGETVYGFSVYLVAGSLPDSSMQVVLEVDGKQFYGTAEQIPEGSALYDQVGGGYVYRFYSESDDRELVWNVGSIHGNSRGFLLTASEIGANTVLEVFVTEVA